jgi:hypothetical protein
LVLAVSNLSVSENLTSGGSITITWTADPTDPATCSFELVNVAFHNTFAIANNIPINSQSITVGLPAVPVSYVILLCYSNPSTHVAYSDQYTLEAVQIKYADGTVVHASYSFYHHTVTSLVYSAPALPSPLGLPRLPRLVLRSRHLLPLRQCFLLPDRATS